MTELSEHIRSIDLVGLVESHGVELRRSGFRMIGLCPLHLDSSPSFFIFPDKNRFKCFGCQKSGDPADFVMEIHQVGFSEALGILGIRSSGQSSPEVHKNIKNRQRRRDLKKAFDEWVRIAADEVATLVRCAHKVALQIKDSETLASLASSATVQSFRGFSLIASIYSH